jgi:hypothetical protein
MSEKKIDWAALRERVANGDPEITQKLAHKWVVELAEWFSDPATRDRTRAVDAEVHIEPVRTADGGLRPGAKLVTISVLLEDIDPRR